jgi:hypothetical protein
LKQTNKLYQICVEFESGTGRRLSLKITDCGAQHSETLLTNRGDGGIETSVLRIVCP